MTLQVRALAGWPGTMHTFLQHKDEGKDTSLDLKVLRTRLVTDPETEIGQIATAQRSEVLMHNRRLYVRCGDGAFLELLEVQPSGKAAMPSEAFTNGLRGSTLSCQNGTS